MTDGAITLTIEKLAGLGDGMALYKGHKVFVPYTLPGDIVRARVTRKTADADYAVLTEILTASADRAKPVCRHFGACGGCALQHLRTEAYATFKHDMARAAVRKAGFDPACVAPLIALPAACRRRTELKVEGGRLGYYAAGSHTLIDLEECPVLEEKLQRLVLRLKPHLIRFPGLQGVKINEVDGGYDILLEGTQAGAWPIRPDPSVVRVSFQRTALLQSGPVTVTLSGIAVEVPPGAFLQASLQAQEFMIARVREAVGVATPVADLFSGLGTYSFALARRAEVSAYEGDTAMSQAVRDAAKAHKLRVEAHTRDLFNRPLSTAELSRFEAAVINPPRTGASAQCVLLARAKIPTLVMVSCNPATFARDARILREGGYKPTRITPIDQFVFSPHLELVAEFSI